MKEYLNKVHEIASSKLYAKLKGAKSGSDDFYELDAKFERVLRRWSNLLHVSSARMEYDIEAAYKAA